MFWKGLKKKKAEKTTTDEKTVISLHSMAQDLCDLLKSDGAILENDDIVSIPDYDLKIRMAIEQMEENNVILHFTLNCPQWDRQLFECCAAFGSDTQQAVGLALGNFAFGLFSGVRAMLHEENDHRTETTFEGKKHRWKVYKSDTIVMSSNPNEKTDPPDYWSMIEPQLSDYLGDSKIAYIKIYGASVNHEITGECRVNDLKIEQLSQQVGDIVNDLNAPGYITHKQFFLLIQDDETCHPYPYTQDQFTEKLRVALSVFEKLLSEEDGYDRCEEELAKQLGDAHLATEIFSFLPELCAQWQFPTLQSGGTLHISFNGEMHQYSISQITAYYMLTFALQQLIPAGEISRDLFVNLISVSAAWGVICSAKEKGDDLTQSECLIQTIYSFSDDYIPR